MPHVSSLGLDGVLAWAQARHVAAASAHRLPAVAARLDEAAGSLLAEPIVTLADDPPFDAAACTGYAICGEGPWLRVPHDRLEPGQCAFVHADEQLPAHCDAVLPADSALVQTTADGARVTARDELTGVPDDRARPALGAGIVRAAARSLAGTVLVPRDRLVTPAVLALAAARGHDDVPVVRPPVVGTLVLGSSLLAHGLPRHGRVRDALGFTVPAFVGALGARANPAVRAPDTRELLLAEIDDANVDVLITTGSTAPGPDNHVRQVLRDLGARWLIDGVAVTPGAQMLMARLPDGRFLVGLPGAPTSALAALVTLLPPLIAALRGAELPAPSAAVLIDDAPPAEFADDSALVPVRLERTASGTIARPLGMALDDWAAGDGIAVVPPGAGYRGDVIEVLPSGPWSQA